MSRTVQTTLTLVPVSYDSTDYQWRTAENIANGYAPSSSTTDAKIYTTVGKSAETWMYYEFDTSSIPDGSTISSMSCTVKAYYSGSTLSTGTVQMCSGTTAKGSSSALTTSNTKVHTLTVGSWTLSELRNARIKVYGKRGTGSSAGTATSHYIGFRGATLTVTYETTYYAVTATSNTGSIIVSPASQEYSAGATATISVIGDITDAQITDNNTDVKSSLSGTSPNYTYTIVSIATDHTFVVYVEASGPNVFLKQNGSWVQAEKVFCKTNGSWVDVTEMFVKENGTWKS